MPHASCLSITLGTAAWNNTLLIGLGLALNRVMTIAAILGEGLPWK